MYEILCLFLQFMNEGINKTSLSMPSSYTTINSTSTQTSLPISLNLSLWIHKSTAICVRNGPYATTNDDVTLH